MTAKTYTIENDRYSNDTVQITFADLVEFCKSAGWDCELEETTNDTIIDETGEIVAIAQ